MRCCEGQASADAVITAGSATAAYLAASGVSGVYLIGSPGLTEELEAHGVRVVAGAEDANRRPPPHACARPACPYLRRQRHRGVPRAGT